MNHLRRYRYSYTLQAVFVAIVVVATITDLLVPTAIVFRTATLALSITFLLRYDRVNWQATAEGRHLMAFTGLVAAFLAYASVNTLVQYIDGTVTSRGDGAWPGQLIVAVVLFQWGAWVLWRRNRLLTIAQREVRQERSG